VPVSTEICHCSGCGARFTGSKTPKYRYNALKIEGNAARRYTVYGCTIRGAEIVSAEVESNASE